MCVCVCLYVCVILYVHVFMYVCVYLRLHVALLGQQLVVLDEVGVERGARASALRLVHQPHSLDGWPTTQAHLPRHCRQVDHEIITPSLRVSCKFQIKHTAHVYTTYKLNTLITLNYIPYISMSQNDHNITGFFVPDLSSSPILLVEDAFVQWDIQILQVIKLNEYL